MNELKDINALVVGLGRSGMAAVRHLRGRGARVVGTDVKGADKLGPIKDEVESLGASLDLGRNDPALISGCDLVVVSPGVPLDLPLLSAAIGSGIPVVGEMELAVREIVRPIIAVTGTNGKTTTTALIGHLLNSAGISACVAGNIGNPILGDLERANASAYVVLEVSSFQLDTAPSLRADIAVWLNVTEDHIDRHGSFRAYVASKAKLFERMKPGGIGIYNACNVEVLRAIGSSHGTLVPFYASGKGQGATAGGPGEGGVRSWREGENLMVATGRGGVHEYPLSGIKLRGTHNIENVLAAISAAEFAGASHEGIRDALSSFRGLPHRLEYVCEHGGVTYFDDSKGTNVGATMMALGSFDMPVVLIAGGQSKGADLSPLVPMVRGKVRKAILMGEAAGEMESLFEGVIATARARTMDDAVRAAAQSAQPGDVVLLSPACASLDMYKDYAERGEAFVRAVKKLT